MMRDRGHHGSDACQLLKLATSWVSTQKLHHGVCEGGVTESPNN